MANAIIPSAGKSARQAKCPAHTALSVPSTARALQGRFQAFEVRGDYMSPTLKPGDVVEVDMLHPVILREGIYLFSFSIGEPAFRRVSFGPNGTTRLSCDVDARIVEIVSAAEFQRRVVGRAARVAKFHQL